MRSLVLLLLSTTISFGQFSDPGFIARLTFPAPAGPGPEPACSTPATGDLFNEGFEGIKTADPYSGFENAGWTFSTAYSIWPDQDYPTPTNSPAGFCNHVLRCRYDWNIGENVFITRDLFGYNRQDTTWYRFWFKCINYTYVTENQTKISLFTITQDGGTHSISLAVKLYFDVYGLPYIMLSDGTFDDSYAGYYLLGQHSVLTQWNYVDVKWSHASTTCELWFNGVKVITGISHGIYLQRYILLGPHASYLTRDLDVVFDRFAVGTTRAP